MRPEKNRTWASLLRSQARIETWMAIVGAVVVIVIMLLTVLDVVGRNLLNRPLPGAYEITEFMLVAAVFLGLALVQAHKRHIQIEFISVRLAPKPQAVLRTVIYLVCLVTFGLIVFQGGRMTYEAWQTGAISEGIVPFPLWPANALIPIGSMAVCFRILIQLIQELAGDRFQDRQ